MALVRVASTKDVPENSMKTYPVQGRKILLINLAGEFHAVGAICTHQGWDLSWGALATRQKQVLCGGHGAVYDIETGEGVKLGRKQAAVPVYRTEVHGEDIMIDLNRINPRRQTLSGKVTQEL